ncbi:MAG: aminopeptidase P family protein, partial [Anaerolineales bacterium]|nr:aminopeptidase P family protein [Anaerolineales bacterium]
MSLIQEKTTQAVEILKEQDTDLWLTFVRETSGVRDPVLDFLIGENDLTWHSAIILTKGGEKIFIVGNLEKEAIARMNVYTGIIGYDKSIKEILRETILRLEPKQIAV